MMHHQAADAVEQIAGEKPVLLRRLYVPGAAAACEVDMPGHPARLVACAFSRHDLQQWTQSTALLRDRCRQLLLPDMLYSGATATGRAGLAWLALRPVAYEPVRGVVEEKQSPAKICWPAIWCGFSLNYMRQSEPAGFGLPGGPLVQRWIDWYAPQLDHLWRVLCSTRGFGCRVPLIRQVAALSRHNAPAIFRESHDIPRCALCRRLPVRVSQYMPGRRCSRLCTFGRLVRSEYAMALMNLQGRKMHLVADMLSGQYPPADDRRALRMAMYCFWETLRQTLQSRSGLLLMPRLVLGARNLQREITRFPSDML
jgi:hypothetical protein